VLLAAGANPKIMDDSGQTALHIAAMKGNHEVLKVSCLQCYVKYSLNKNDTV
jgi:ankyrin repeat protein